MRFQFLRGLWFIVLVELVVDVGLQGWDPLINQSQT